MNNTGQFGGTPGIDINVEGAWEITKGKTDLKIAVIDDGIENHYDLIDSQGNSILLAGYTPRNGGNGTPHLSEDGHGIACAGIISATHNNSLTRGVVPIARLMGANIFYPNTSDADVALAIRWAVDNGAEIISNSWGYQGFTGSVPEVANAIDYALSNGVIVVFASGNSNVVEFPGNHPGVYTVSGINRNGSIWGYTGSSSTIEIVAPTGNVNLQGDQYTLDRIGSNGYSSNDYLTKFGGTSGAAPQIAGIFGLMKSINPNLTSSELQSILNSTATDLGTAGKDNTFGYGLANALKAVYKAQRMAVQDQMVHYKSLNADATGSNSARRMVYDQPSGTYHNVFSSGSEIVYYKRPPWGSPSTPVLLTKEQTSASIGRNFNPSITVDKHGVIHVVWEHHAYGIDPSFGQYITYYTKSTDGGNSWSTEKTITPVSHVPMNPQILSHKAPYDDDLMLVYHYLNYIRARLYNPGTDSWDPWDPDSFPAKDAVPNTYYKDRFSAIAADRFSSSIFNVVYTSGSSGHIYYNFFNGPYEWTSEKNLSSIVSGSGTHHSPSIASGPNGSQEIHVAWTRTSGAGGGPYDNKVFHRWTSDAYNWPNVYQMTYYQAQLKPTISSVGSNDVHLIWEIQDNSGIAKQHFNGSLWNSPTTITNDGVNPSLAYGGSQSKYLYTKETGPNHDVVLSSETLSKTVLNDPNFNPDDMVYKRSISFMDTSGAYLEFIVHDIGVKESPSFRNSLSMKEIHQDTIDLSLRNALKNLRVGNELIHTQSSVDFVLEINGQNVSDLFESGAVPNLRLGNQLNGLRSNTPEILLGEIQKPETFSVEIPAEMIAGNGNALLTLEEYNFKDGVIASLGHINAPRNPDIRMQAKAVKANTESASGIQLSNYPNPFNPSTQISFVLPKKAFVELKVYDVLGREVADLLNEVREAGSHKVLFNASYLSSGVYLYQLKSGSTVITNKFMLIK